MTKRFALRRASPRSEIGVALDRERLVATAAGKAGSPGLDAFETIDHSLDSSDFGGGLKRAFADLTERLPVGRLNVALGGGLARLRRISVPPLKDEELRRVISRDARRYFPNVVEPQIVGANVLERVGRRFGRETVLAGAAPAHLLEALFAAAAEFGYEVGSVVPIEAAWLSASEEMWPRLWRHGGQLVSVSESLIEVLCIRNHELALVRRLPPSAPTERLLEALDECAGEVSSSRRVALLGPASLRDPLAELLETRGFVPTEPAAHGELATFPAAVAAAFTGSDSRPQLLPERVHLARRHADNRASLRIAAAAVALLVIAAGLQLWGSRRELAGVATHREAIRAEVEKAMDERSGALSLVEGARALVEIEESRPWWSLVIADLADHLPRDAHLLSLVGRRDSLLVRGIAERAAGVFEGLESVSRLSEIASDEPVRREQGVAGTPIERFALSAVLDATLDEDHPDGPPSSEEPEAPEEESDR